VRGCVVALAASLAAGALSAEEAKVELLPGSYRLSMVSTYGKLKGRSVQGQVTLRPARPDDKSPRTGKSPDDGYSTPPLLIGWSDVAFRDVGAPLCLREAEPTSQDPVYPGVMVTTDRSPPNSPVLLVGTNSNVRDGSRARMTDGCGVGLFVQKAQGACLHGVWKEYGLARRLDGDFKSPLGTFALCSR
jgi:hypothetical protein